MVTQKGSRWRLFFPDWLIDQCHTLNAFALFMSFQMMLWLCAAFVSATYFSQAQSSSFQISFQMDFSLEAHKNVQSSRRVTMWAHFCCYCVPWGSMGGRVFLHHFINTILFFQLWGGCMSTPMQDTKNHRLLQHATHTINIYVHQTLNYVLDVLYFSGGGVACGLRESTSVF